MNTLYKDRIRKHKGAGYAWIHKLISLLFTFQNQFSLKYNKRYVKSKIYK